jgi:N-acetylglucosamine kinase-like BadF-type ATPase
MTELFLAIDGGQSGTVAVLATADGTIIGVGHGGPIRHHEEPDAEGYVRRGLSAAVTQAMSRTATGASVVICCLSTTGSAAIVDRVIRELVPAENYFVLQSDTFAALASGTAGEGGIGLIAGTGTVALALGRRGERVLVGGWGWLLGDEGGGFWIAMEALKAAARDVDGTGPATHLTTELSTILGQKDMRGVYNLVTGDRLDRTAIAALAVTVSSVADSGDLVAASILDLAATRLAELVVATIAAAPFLESDEHVVVACGGVLRANGQVMSGLARLLAERAPDFRVIVPTVPPVIGAYYLALKERGFQIDDELRDRITNQVRSLSNLTTKMICNEPKQPTQLP